MEHDLHELDIDFLLETKPNISFTLVPGYFQSLQYKKEIRFLIKTYWFKTNEMSFYKKFNKRDLKLGIKELRKLNLVAFNNLVDYQMPGIGPGEILCYFLFDDVMIGGPRAGIDIIASKKSYEMKMAQPITSAGIWGPGTFINNFKLGGSIDFSDIISDLRKLKEKLSKRYPDIKELDVKEVGHGIYKLFAEKYPEEWNSIVQKFQDKAFEYLAHDNLIFISGDNKCGYSRGDLIEIGKIKKENILLDNQTSGTIKPIIKVKSHIK